MIISARLASMVELDTVLGCEDLYNLLEIMAIDAYNQKLANEKNNGNHY